VLKGFLRLLGTLEIITVRLRRNEHHALIIDWIHRLLSTRCIAVVAAEVKSGKQVRSTVHESCRSRFLDLLLIMQVMQTLNPNL
jgi:hypothetical protein